VPVFHDDQHGTAIVVLAALCNALRVVSKQLSDVRIVVSGAGAAGVATVRLLQEAGARRIAAYDSHGAVHPGRDGLSKPKRWLAGHTKPPEPGTSLGETLAGADVFVGVRGPGVIGADEVAAMADGAVIFALAKPPAGVSRTGGSGHPPQSMQSIGDRRRFGDLAASDMAQPLGRMLPPAESPIANDYADLRINMY
jgi:malate dehydrogenase (oxaloacetate-decarboxylating)